MRALIDAMASIIDTRMVRQQDCWELCDCHVADRREEARLISSESRRRSS